MTSSFPIPRTDSAARNEYNKNYIQGGGQGGYGLFDTWGLTEGLFGLGGKNKDLQQILNDSSTKYTPGQGYDLNWWQRNVSKITDQDVYNAQRSREVSGLRNKYGDQAEKYGINIDGTTTVANFDTQLTDAQDIERLSTSLRDIKDGGAKIAELEANGPLTPDRLRTAIVDLNQYNKNTDPDTIKARALVDQQISSSRTQAENSSRQLDITEKTNQDNAEWRKFESTERRKEAALQRQENALERNSRDRDRAQERLLTAETNQMNLQFKYAQLAQSERIRAQERKDTAIMALVNGLGNLGAAFAI